MFFNKIRLKKERVKEIEEKFNKDLAEVDLEKSDIPAMIIAALITLFPVLIIVGGLGFLVLFFFMR